MFLVPVQRCLAPLPLPRSLAALTICSRLFLRSANAPAHPLHVAYLRAGNSKSVVCLARLEFGAAEGLLAGPRERFPHLRGRLPSYKSCRPSPTLAPPREIPPAPPPRELDRSWHIPRCGRTASMPPIRARLKLQ